MKAAVLVKHGKVETAFSVQEHPKPEPQANQVLIKTEGFGLNFADVMARNGLYREAPPLPSVIGYDVVGRIEAVGEGLNADDYVGKRVVAMCRFGGYAEYVATDHKGFAEISEEMDLGEAVALAVQYCTAWYAACEMVNLHEGDKVLVHAAAGGVGTAITQIAKWKGCTVFGTASEHKKDYCLQNGVDHVINYRNSDYLEEVKKILGPNDRLDVTFNSLAGKTIKKDRSLLGSTGRLVCYGGAERAGRGGGIFTTIRFLLNTGFVNPLFLMMLSKGIIGVNMLKVADNKPDTFNRCIRNVVAQAEAGVLKPHVGGRFSIDELQKAHTFLESRKSMGKIVVKW